MPFIYSEVDGLQATVKVGSKQCVALLQYYAKLPHTSLWREGRAVFGNLSIAKGTAIATFINGKYLSRPTGNHAALYLAQDAAGIWVMDQWADDSAKPKVTKRYLRKKGKRPDGTYADPGNNAEAYAVIE